MIGTKSTMFLLLTSAMASILVQHKTSEGGAQRENATAGKRVLPEVLLDGLVHQLVREPVHAALCVLDYGDLAGAEELGGYNDAAERVYRRAAGLVAPGRYVGFVTRLYPCILSRGGISLFSLRKDWVGPGWGDSHSG